MFRFACSVVLQGWSSAADRYCCVWGALTVFWPHWVFPHSRVCALPVYTVQAPGCSIWSGPCVACGSSFRVLHKSADSVGPAFCAFPSLSSSGSQELDGHTLPRCLPTVRLLPSAVPASVSACTSRVHVACAYSWDLVSSRDPPGGCRPSRISGSLWLEIGGLLQFGRGAVSVPSVPLSPTPCLLPPAGMGRSAAGYLFSGIAQSLCSENGQKINFLSISCYPTV